MRRRLAFLSLAVSSLVVLAFLIPLGILVRNQAENRALTRGERFAESIAASLAITEARDLAIAGGEVVLQAFGSPEGISIVYPSGAVVGDPVTVGTNLDLAREGAAFTARIAGGAEVLVPVLSADSPAADSTVVVRAFIANEELSRGVATAWLLLLGLGVFLVVVAVAAADRLGQSIVRPVTDLSRAARTLGEGDLTTRVVPQGPEEIADVGVAFNFLAGRLGGMVEAERESVADLSHRLRTPLTALRLQAETLADPAEAEALLADVDRMERAIDSMIAEARRAPAEPAPAVADLGRVVRHRASFWQVLADEQGRPTSVLVGYGPHPVAMAEAELGALVDVLIENVFAHTEPPAGYIIRVDDHHDGTTILVVEDDGPGFRDLSVLRRGMSSRGSTGLGLDIVARAAERAGGRFKIGNSPSGGAQAVVAFKPMVPAVVTAGVHGSAASPRESGP